MECIFAVCLIGFERLFYSTEISTNNRNLNSVTQSISHHVLTPSTVQKVGNPVKVNSRNEFLTRSTILSTVPIISSEETWRISIFDINIVSVVNYSDHPSPNLSDPLTNVTVDIADTRKRSRNAPFLPLLGPRRRRKDEGNGPHGRKDKVKL